MSGIYSVAARAGRFNARSGGSGECVTNRSRSPDGFLIANFHPLGLDARPQRVVDTIARGNVLCARFADPP